ASRHRLETLEDAQAPGKRVAGWRGGKLGRTIASLERFLLGSQLLLIELQKLSFELHNTILLDSHIQKLLAVLLIIGHGLQRSGQLVALPGQVVFLGQSGKGLEERQKKCK